MHYIDADKTNKEKARREQHKNATSNSEQILEATPHETAAEWPFAFHINQTNKTCETLQEKQRRNESNVLQWTPSYERARVGQPIRTNQQQLSADTGCNVEGLSGAMDDRDERREREREIKRERERERERERGRCYIITE